MKVMKRQSMEERWSTRLRVKRVRIDSIPQDVLIALAINGEPSDILVDICVERLS